MKSDKISLFNNPRSKLTYFYTPFVYIKHGGPFCKFLGPSVLASIFLKKTDFRVQILQKKILVLNCTPTGPYK